MKQALAIAAVVAVGLVASAPAGAGSTKGPTLRSLQAQITTLKRQVKTLRKQVTQARDVAILGVTFGVCSTAVTADTFQDTFTGLNSYFGAHSLPAYFGAQTTVNDQGACQALSISRQHNQSPPTTNVLRALLDLFSASSAVTEASEGLASPGGGYAFSRLFALTP